MSRPKGSKNKPKINMEGVKNYQQPIQNPSYEKIKSEIEGAQQVQTVVNTMLGTGMMKEKGAPIPDLWPANLMEDIHADKAKRDWLTKDALNIYEWCQKKGLPPSELIEKFEGLEIQIKLAEKELTDTLEGQGLIPSKDNQNKPNTAPQTGKSGKTTQKEEKGKEGAENDPIKYVKEHQEYYDAPPIDSEKIKDEYPQFNEPKIEAKVAYYDNKGRKTGESKPKELSPFLKSRQNLKNGMK